jgi:SAM-dependent methyltransferase
MASGAVLEVGGGVCQRFRRSIWRKGKEHSWAGIDPNWDDRPHKQRYHGTADQIPFGDEAFDLVGSFQSMEHWDESPDYIKKGIKEIYRVLKPGGKFVATVPIHSHGGKLFVLGEIDTIRSCFGDEWEKVEFEEWRKDYAPLPPSYADERDLKKLRKVVPADIMVREWILEMRAWKKL